MDPYFFPVLLAVLGFMVPDAANGQTNSITLLVRDEGKQAINNALVIVESYSVGDQLKNLNEAERTLLNVENRQGGIYASGNPRDSKDKVLQFVVLSGDNKDNYRVAICRNIDGSFENRMAIIPPLFRN